ncbi:MAG: PAS domain S-box protein [Prolixibacteraceae bacterium]|nr:PAS domain S-box protein [Prolixibacteraceae bacterium]MBN2773487.1 PAS domain S-box protein [Prolixibacteraceae bacterium]
MKYPSLLNRIITGLIINSSIVLLLCIVFIRNIQKIDSVNKDLIEHPFTVSNAVKDVHIGITSIHRSMKDVSQSPSVESLEEANLKVENYDNGVIESFKIIAERYLGDKEDVNTALKSFENWRPIRAEVIALAKEGKNGDAYNITAQKGAQYVDSLLKQIKVIENFAMNKANEINSTSEQISKKTVRNSVIYLSVAALLFLIITSWFYTGLSSPLKKITSRINSISKSDPLNFPIPETKNILSVLHSSVDNLESLVHNLETLVLKRTQELANEKEFTELALNNQIDTFFVFDPEEGKAIRWNKTFTEISGYSDKEIAKLKVPDSYYSPEDLKNVEKINSEVYNTGYGMVKLDLTTKKREKIPFEYIITKLTDKKTGKLYLVSIGRNIKERLAREAELEKYRNHLQALVNEQTEEIQAINEELKTANEEQASLNEELAASNEELVATNEELATANNDLERLTNKLTKSNKELIEANSELERFNSLFVDREFRIKELKEQIKELKNKLEKNEN